MPKTKKTTLKHTRKKVAKRTPTKLVKKSSRRSAKKATKKTQRGTIKKVTKKKISPVHAQRAGDKKQIKKTIKRTNKKARLKKRTAKKARRELVVALEAECFWVHEGPVLKDLRDLAKAFKAMEDRQFSHHTQGQNDFANWVEGVLADKPCAKALRKAATKSESLFILDKVLIQYS